MIECIPQCIWNDFSTIAGECILEAKLYMMNHPSNQPDYQMEEIFGMNYFGDPALNLMPQGGFIIKNPTTISYNSLVPSHTIPSPITVKSGVNLKISDGCTIYLSLIWR